MNRTVTPHILLVAALAGWLNREQQKVLEYLREENRVLKQQLGSRGRLRLSDDQRWRLAAKAKELGRSLLDEFATIVAPDTLMRWHRKLIAQKWANNAGGGRPGTMKVIEDLVVRMAIENLTWGYRRIEGALFNLGHCVRHNTVKRILKDHGIEPAPERTRRTSWKDFLRIHWDSIAAADFFTTEVWTPRGLVTIYTLFVIKLSSRKVHIVGSTKHPNAEFMNQAALDLAGFDDGFLRGSSHLIIDRDPKFTADFKQRLKDDAGVEPIVLPPRSPNLNAYAERFVRSVKSECLSRMIFFGRASLDRALKEYVQHYHAERNHQGIDNKLIEGVAMPIDGEVVRTKRLGGLLSFYRRAA